MPLKREYSASQVLDICLKAADRTVRMHAKGAHDRPGLRPGVRRSLFQRRWPAALALTANIAFSFYLGANLLFGPDGHARSGAEQHGEQREVKAGWAMRDAESKPPIARSSSGHNRGRGRGGLHKPVDDEDGGLAKKELLKVTSGREHSHSRPDLHMRCVDPKAAVHVVFPVTRREFAAAAASAFSILKHASRPEAVYFHFIVPKGTRTDGLCARLRLYAHTFPEHFCHGRRGGLRQSVQLMHRPKPAAPKRSKFPGPAAPLRGHAANESVAWSIHRGGQDGTATKRALLMYSSPVKRLGGKLSDMRNQASQRLQMARKIQPASLPLKQLPHGPVKLKGPAGMVPLPKPSHDKAEVKPGAQGHEQQFRTTAAVQRGQAPSGSAGVDGRGSEDSDSWGTAVEIPQCTSLSDSRAVKRAADRAMEAAEQAKRLEQLEDKLAECTVVPGLENYTYRNATDCERPESLEALVKPVRLVGWEDEDRLDKVFEVARPCSCGFTQASIVRFNISRWVEPADIMESTWMMRDSAALVSYAKVFLDDLLLPWNVPAAIVLEPDTLVTGDIGRLWNSSVVTKRHTAQAGRVEEQKQAENSQVWVQGDEVTEVQDLPEQPSVHGNLLAAVKDCNVPQSKIYSFKSFTVSRLVQKKECSILRGVFLMDVEAYAAKHMQSKVLDLLLRNKAGDRLWAEADGHADKAFFLALGRSQAAALDSSWNLAGLGTYPGYKPAEIKAANLLHWSGPRKPWMTGGYYQGKWAQYYLHWEAPRPVKTPALTPTAESGSMPTESPRGQGWLAWALAWFEYLMRPRDV